MATSSFTKEFSVKKEVANKFVREYQKTPIPTLNSSFNSNLAIPMQDSDLKEKLLAALHK